MNMGKPTAVENVSLDRLKTLAERLENGTASDRDRDEALGTTLKMFAAERELGLVSVDELDRHKKEDHNIAEAVRVHIANCPNKQAQWNSAKAWTIIVSVITVCGTIFGIFYMAFSK